MTPNDISRRALALSALDTHALSRLYSSSDDGTKLPRVFMINSLIAREFGQHVYNEQASKITGSAPSFINNIRNIFAAQK